MVDPESLKVTKKHFAIAENRQSKKDPDFLVRIFFFYHGMGGVMNSPFTSLHKSLNTICTGCRANVYKMCVVIVKIRGWWLSSRARRYSNGLKIFAK